MFESGQQHIANKNDLKRVFGILKSLAQTLPSAFISDVLLPLRAIRGRACHDDLQYSSLIVLVVPVGAELNDLVVQINADSAAHADDHCLTVHSFEPFLEMRDHSRLLCIRQFELCQSAFVIDGNSGLILDRTLNVVDADVIAKNGSSIGVGFFNGRSSETDERCLRERISHVACEAVDEI